MWNRSDGSLAEEEFAAFSVRVGKVHWPLPGRVADRYEPRIKLHKEPERLQLAVAGREVRGGVAIVVLLSCRERECSARPAEDVDVAVGCGVMDGRVSAALARIEVGRVRLG